VDARISIKLLDHKVWCGLVQFF